jgi:hypothetical protein
MRSTQSSVGLLWKGKRLSLVSHSLPQRPPFVVTCRLGKKSEDVIMNVEIFLNQKMATYYTIKIRARH